MPTSVEFAGILAALAVFAFTLFWPAYDCTHRDPDDFAVGTESWWRLALLIGFLTGAFPIVGGVYLWTVVRPGKRRARATQ
ncbi:MAG: hypothetical protein WDA27_10220 [Actinomycetota bacterium]